MENKELRNLRLILFIFAILSPVSSINIVKLNPQFYDPISIRFFFSFIYLFFIFGTYYIPFVKIHYRKLVIVLAYILLFFQLFLMMRNDFDRSYVSGYVFLAFLVLLYLKSMLAVISYAVASFLILLTVYLLYKNEDLVLSTGHLRFLFFMNLLASLIRIYGIKREERLQKFSEQLSNSEEKYKNLLESAPDAIVTVDTYGKITGINKRGTELFQYIQDELLGKQIEVLIPKRYSLNHQRDRESFIDQPKTREMGEGRELFAKRKNGEEFPVEISLSPIIDNDNKIIIAIIRDISKRIAAEKELNEIKLKLQQKELTEKVSIAKSEFISKMSHEIRTPLNGIYGFTNILLKEDLDPAQKNYIENIKFSSELLTVLINDILDNTNLETGNITLELNEIDIKKLIENVIESFKTRLEDKKLMLTATYSDSILNKEIFPKGDLLRMSQIIMNLLSNAIKFSNNSGKIELNASIIDYSDENVELVLSITDYGIGIPENMIEEIFQPYIQVSSAISKKYGGNGLGLSIVKNLIDKMGGSISAKSGEKTVFTIKIPLQKTEHIDVIDPETLKLDKNLTKNLNILIVEDNEMNQFLMKTILGKLSLKHEVAENGLEALKLMENTKFDIVFMDLMMPVMDGFTCAKIIKNEKHLDCFIIALTADVKNSLDPEMSKLFDGYIKKPFEEHELVNYIYKFTNKNKSSI